MNDWYYRFLGTEFGPVRFEDLISLAKDGQLSGNDEVRLGDSGIWRRAGSMGQLMAHFPFESGKKVILAKTSSNSADQKRRDPVAKTQEIRSSSSSISVESPDPVLSNDVVLYWCLIQGKEYGPVELPLLIDWINAGRLHRDDRVRVGLAPYVLADELPGLFPKLPKAVENDTKVGISTISDTKFMDTIKSTASGFTDTKSPTLKPSTARSPIQVEKTPTSPIPAPKPVSLANDFGVGSGAASRPRIPVQRPAFKKSSSGGIQDLLTGKPAMGVGGTLLLGVVLYFSFPYMSLGDSANARRFKELRNAYIELARLRSDDNVQPNSFLPLKEKIETVAKKVLDEVKGSKDPEQKKLLSLAKKMEELSKEQLGMKPSNSEAIVSKAIAETGKRLGVM